MKNKALLIILITVGTLVVGVTAAKVSGYWKTESTKVPQKIAAGEFSGEYNPSDIRGSYSFGDIEAAFEIPSATLAEAFGFPGDSPESILAKEMEDIWEGLPDGLEVGTDSIKLFTALWTNLPHEPEETTVLPVRAVELLRDSGKIDPATAERLLAEAVQFPGASGESPVDSSPDEAADEETHEAPERMVRGLTTFGDIKSWGVDETAWETAFGEPMGARSTSLKDWVEEKSLSMSAVKITVQELVDAAGQD